MHQGILPFDDAPEPEPDEDRGPEGTRKPSIDERFAEWIEGHGAEVYRNFADVARQVRDSGRARFGGKALAEICRFRRIIEGKDDEGWKVNNSFVALMVRRLIEENEGYAEFFELRRLRASGGKGS